MHPEIIAEFSEMDISEIELNKDKIQEFNYINNHISSLIKDDVSIEEFKK